MKQSVRIIGGPLLLVAALIVARILIPQKMNFITEISIFSIYVMGCNVLYGYLGMVSFGQPFYLGVGAYAAAIYLAYLGTNPSGLHPHGNPNRRCHRGAFWVLFLLGSGETTLPSSMPPSAPSVSSSLKNSFFPSPEGTTAYGTGPE